MTILLDSNAYTLFCAGHRQVGQLVYAAQEILVSAIVVGELLSGFRQGSRFDDNVAELRAVLDDPYVSFVPVDFVTADRYARISASLQAKGRPIPTNDIWIAAHAMETGADLVSADRHFEHVDGIAWVRLSES